MMRCTAMKKMIVFSELSPVLQKLQESYKSTSNIWVEKWMVESQSPTNVFKLKPNAKTVNVLAKKQIVLYNGDYITNLPKDIVDVPRDTSLTTGNEYKGKFLKEMEERRMKHSLSSKWWASTGSCTTDPARTTDKRKYILSSKARQSIVLMQSQTEVYHISAMEDAEVLAHMPISGGSARPYSNSSETCDLLKADMQNNGFDSGLYFTERQLTALELSPKPDAISLMLSSGSNDDRFKLYCLSQLEEYKDIIKDRPEPDVPCFFSSAMQVSKDSLIAAVNQHESNYVMSLSDIHLHNWNVKESEKSKNLASNTFAGSKMFNVSQLTDPAQGFKVAGHIAM